MIVQLVKGSLILLGELALIFVVVMVVLEFLQEYKVLDKITAIASPITNIIGIPREANLPLLTGMGLGISYGAGIIINTAREGKLSVKDIYLVNMFLVICHGLIEDTLVWSALGAKIIPVQIGRLILAVLLCYICSRYFDKIAHHDKTGKPVISKDIFPGG